MPSCFICGRSKTAKSKYENISFHNEITALGQGVERSLEDTLTDPVKCAKKYETKKERLDKTVTAVGVLGEASNERNEMLKNYYQVKIEHLQHMENLKERSAIAKENISSQITTISNALCEFFSGSDETV